MGSCLDDSVARAVLPPVAQTCRRACRRRCRALCPPPRTQEHRSSKKAGCIPGTARRSALSTGRRSCRCTPLRNRCPWPAGRACRCYSPNVRGNDSARHCRLPRRYRMPVPRWQSEIPAQLFVVVSSTQLVTPSAHNDELRIRYHGAVSTRQLHAKTERRQRPCVQSQQPRCGVRRLLRRKQHGDHVSRQRCLRIRQGSERHQPRFHHGRHVRRPGD